MVYLQSFSFPDDGQEFDFILNEKRKCYTSFYPFKILSRHRFERVDFEPITIFYGGNGSGKSTALHVIAACAGIPCDAAFNRTSFFEDYLSLCRMEVCGEIPKGSRLIASDDVFDTMLDIRAMNDGMDNKREEIFNEYLENKRSHFQLSSMADYEQLRRVNSARHKT